MNLKHIFIEHNKGFLFVVAIVINIFTVFGMLDDLTLLSIAKFYYFLAVNVLLVYFWFGHGFIIGYRWRKEN